MMTLLLRSIVIIALAIFGVAILACTPGQREPAATDSAAAVTATPTPAGGPTVIISLPKAGRELKQGLPVEVQYEALAGQGIRRVDLLVDDQVVNTSEFVPQPGSVFVSKMNWMPQEPGSHTLRVQVYNPAGEIGRSDKILVKVVSAVPPTPTGTPSPTLAPASPTPQRTPTTRQGDVLPTFTASPTSPPSTPSHPHLVVRIQPGLNVRQGPGTAYERVGFLPAGEQAEILGQSDIGAGRWWLIRFDPVPGSRGWVSASAAYSDSFNTGNVPLVAPPPTPVPPTPVPTPTATPAPVAQQPQIDFGADRTQIRAGECITVYWNAANVKEVYYRGQGVPGTNQSRVECPTLTETYELRVVRQDGQIETRSIRIEVVGTGTQSAELELGEGIDFDEDGKVSSSGDDFKWVKDGGERRFKKWDGDDDIKLVPIGPMGLEVVTQNNCRQALDELDDTESIEPFPGLGACFRTDESRMGILRFEDVDDDVDFEWALWD